MCRFVKTTQAEKIILGTEVGVIHRLQKENPGKVFIPVSKRVVCPNMKLTRLESIVWCLQEMSGQIKVPDDISIKARVAIEGMLDVSG
jgi:quinolinate synthase